MLVCDKCFKNIIDKKYNCDILVENVKRKRREVQKIDICLDCFVNMLQNTEQFLKDIKTKNHEVGIEMITV